MWAAVGALLVGAMFLGAFTGSPRSRDLGVWVGAGVPALAGVTAAGVFLSEWAASLTELAAASPRGLAWLWRARSIVALACATVVSAVGYVLREGLDARTAGLALPSACVDAAVFSGIGSFLVSRTGSFAGAAAGCLAAWFAAAMIGIRPPFGQDLFAAATPLSVYFRGSASAEWGNRLVWAAAAAVLLRATHIRLRRPERLLHGGDE
ncbi:MAG: hypothetical protein IRZ11_05940 [Clostridia bacterium]|nr:hypothetical protein [Clostridia bacterium]